MKLVFLHENSIIVALAKSILSENGIDAFIKNEFIAGGAGDLSPIDTWPELWVNNAADAPSASALVDAMSRQNEADGWECKGCGEANGPAFDLCWQFQSGKT